MGFQRRKMLQFAGTAGLLAAVPALAAVAVARPGLRRFRINDSHSLPLLAPGSVVAVDSSVIRFARDGVYLYPAWGSPRPYLVRRATAGHLVFSDPAGQRELWQQALQDERFAGLVLPAGACSQAALACSLPLLVPALPGA